MKTKRKQGELYLTINEKGFKQGYNENQRRSLYNDKRINLTRGYNCKDACTQHRRT